MTVNSLVGFAAFLASQAAGLVAGDEGHVRKVVDYPGHEECVRHHPDCKRGKAMIANREAQPHHTTNNGVPCVTAMEPVTGRVPMHLDCEGCFYVEPIYLQATYIGATIEDREINGYDDSDFYAVVWDAAKGEPAKVFYGTTRGWTYPAGCHVDATPEVLAAYRGWQQAQANQARAAQQAREAKAQAERDTRTAEYRRVAALKGRQVEIQSGNNKGKRGTLYWIGYSQSGMSVRVGVRQSNGDMLWGPSGMFRVL